MDGPGGRGRGPGRPREAAKHRAILDAGLELFAEGGLDRASIDQIAKRAGVTRATIYRRWPSREALVAEALGSIRTRAESELGDWTETPLASLLHVLVERTPELLESDQALRLIAQLIGSAPSHPELLETYWATYLAPSRTTFGKILEQARAAGQTASDLDAEVVQDLIAGALLFRLLVNPGPTNPVQRRDYIVRILRQVGLGNFVSDQTVSPAD